MQISVTMLSMTGGHSDAWLPSGARGAWGTTYPGMPDGVCDGVDGVARKVREMIRAGADVIKIASSRRVPLADRRSAQPNFTEAEVRSIVATAADLGRLGDVARARRRGHQARGPRRRALGRPRHVPRRRGHRAHARARDVARADAHRGRHDRRARERPEDPRAGPREAPHARPPRARGVPPRRRGRREGRDGHRLPGRAPRHEPARARADGRATASRPSRRSSPGPRAPPS